MTHGSQPEPPITAPFSQWLRWALTHAGYDLDERGARRKISDASGIPPATVSRLLRDISRPDLATCYAIGRTLGIRVMPILVRAGHLPPRRWKQNPTHLSGPDHPQQKRTRLLRSD